MVSKQGGSLLASDFALQATDAGRSCALEVGIFASHLVWLARTRRMRKEAAAAGKSFDDIAAEHEARGVPFPFAERKRGKAVETTSDAEKGLSRVPADDKETRVLGPVEEDAGDTSNTEKP